MLRAVPPALRNEGTARVCVSEMPRQFLHLLVCAFWTVLRTIDIDLLQYCCSRHAGYWLYLHCPTLRYLDAPIRPVV